MSQGKILYCIFDQMFKFFHKKRRNTLMECTEALLLGSNLTLTDIGRHIKNATTVKHNIKKVDRLLSNGSIHRALPSLYKGLVANVIQWLYLSPTLPLIVDVCFIKNHGEIQTLRASLPTSGRALTVYEKVYYQGQLKSNQSHFLKTLKDILPKDRQVIFICDAGFFVEWYKEIEGYGWDWIGRIRSGHSLRIEGDWITAKEMLYEMEKKCDWEDVDLDRRNKFPCRIVCYKKKKKGRVNKNCYGRKVKHKTSTVYEQSNREPWLLATSLEQDEYPLIKVVKLYEKRMSIEESFRDMKSDFFGLGGCHSRSRCPKRWSVLLLLANITVLISLIVGKYVRKKNLYRGYQASSCYSKKVYSDVFLGFLYIKKNDEFSFIFEAWQNCHTFAWGE